KRRKSDTDAKYQKIADLEAKLLRKQEVVLGTGHRRCCISGRCGRSVSVVPSLSLPASQSPDSLLEPEWTDGLPGLPGKRRGQQPGKSLAFVYGQGRGSGGRSFSASS